MPEPTDDSSDNLDIAQTQLNRAVNAWVHSLGTPREAHQEAWLVSCHRIFQTETARAFNAAANTLAAAKMPERYDTATELRIANLLQAAMYPTHLGVNDADGRRRAAMNQALTMLGLAEPPQ